ncbi:MAG: cobaltochelatase subunit CobN [Actinomycetota bacterium]|nr:cobaltochelatase subunit CobN [Actinomycetota bacterium]
MILLLSNADTDILAVRSVLEGLPEGLGPVRAANPSTLAGPPPLDDVDVVLVRLLGGRRAWEAPFDELRRRCIAEGIPLLAFAGEAAPDAELTALSTAPAATVAQAFEYLVHGGLANMEGLLRFVADTVLMGGFGFDAPVPVPATGVFGDRHLDPDRPTVGIVFYRAHLLSGNTGFVDDLAEALSARGVNALPVYCYSLRPGPDGGVDALDLLADAGVAAVVTTVLAMGSADGDQWDASALAALDVPIVQAVTATASAAAWAHSAAGLGPLDVAMAVAIPEFDGRIVSVPFSFKEVVDDGDELGTPVTAYRTVADRVDRVAGIAARLAMLGRVPPAQRRIAIVLSAYPTKRSRLGNAVALDTPASVVALLHELAAAGYRVDRIPDDGDALMHELAAGFPADQGSAENAPAAGALRWDGEAYAERFAALDPALRDQVVGAWGDAPGLVWRDGDDLVFPGIDLGGVLVAVQPPRGFGEDPVAVYHSPDLPPTHHYLAFYRWLDEVWGAHAVVHAGKHGTLEWLPGKGVGLSAACAPDAVLGDLPLVYPFVVNDPGEGTQAKRRAHAVIVDHLLPPMTRADTYDDLARLETLLDEHARVAALDPDKLAAIRAQVWDLLVEAEIHRDLGVADAPSAEAFDELVLHVDGYLCELKDAQIRGGLHVLGRQPEGEAELDLVLAITRLAQGQVPSLRARLDPDAGRAEVDRVEAENRRTLAGLQAAGWQTASDDPTLRWVCDTLVPALHRTGDELGSVLRALSGRHVPAGPSGAPTRGMAHVLPTGRNFYSVDPKAVPSPLAWEVGQALADALIARHVADEGTVPACVGLVVWGTAAMRTMGDDVAQALALIGVRPCWQAESGRVTGLELIGDDELGRPRVDVTLRISGFFRDAFPHVVHLLDDALALAGFDDDPRIFGAKPGAYGSGILPLLESRHWRSDADLAAVYEAWSGWSYGRRAMGAPAAGAMRRRFAAIDVAVKNQDNREHDIFDSDDYLQDHGGMIATVRALTGHQPKAFFGDTANPARPRVRTLAEEAARVVRTRVVNPKWITAMQRHGYKGAFEMAATVDYLFGYDATAHVVEDWMYERVTRAYVADPQVRAFFARSNPWALRSIAERLLEANERELWAASAEALATLRAALLEAEGWEESR